MSTAAFIAYAQLATAVLLLGIGLGFGLLGCGGEWLTRGAAGLALRLHINPVVIGLTIVAMATSMPELITCLLGAFQGETDLAVGNLIGSNLGNIGLILGVAALIRPLHLQARLIDREMPILLGATVLFSLFCLGGLQAWEGLLLITGMTYYLIVTVNSARTLPLEAKEALTSETQPSQRSLSTCLALIGIGSVALAVGADVLVNTSIIVAQRCGVNAFIIGLTLVAIGTSLPELAASIAAALHKHGDICAGNILGSNLFNMLFIGGGVTAIVPLPVQPQLFGFEIPAMVALTVLLWIVFKFGQRINRWEGAGLLVIYLGVISWAVYSRLDPTSS